MILIQIVLILAFLLLLLKFLANPASSKMRAWKKIMGVAFTFVAIFVVIFPESSNDLAHVLGVGRGADLLLYLLTVAVILLCINLYMKGQRDRQQLVALARKVALLDAEVRKRNRRR